VKGGKAKGYVGGSAHGDFSQSLDELRQISPIFCSFLGARSKSTNEVPWDQSLSDFEVGSRKSELS